MRSHRLALLFLLALTQLVSCRSGSRWRWRDSKPGKPRYDRVETPETETVEHVDEYHGKEVRDPYRWLEDMESDGVRSWIEAQNKATRGYLDGLPLRGRIRERMDELINFERYGVPFKEGGRYFFRKNDGLQNQSVLYVSDSLEGEARMLLDPNTLSEDGTVALRGTDVSPDGRHLAYSISRGGSDWREIKVRDIETGQDLAADHLKWIKFAGASWLKDGSGFFYRRLPEPEEGKALSAASMGGKIYFHALGTPQDEDRLVYERPDKPKWSLFPEMSDDGRYLIIYVSTGSTGDNGLFYKDLAADGPVVELVATFDAQTSFLDSDGDAWWVVTDHDAPTRRVMRIDLKNPSREEWQEVIPAGKYSIEGIVVAGGHFVVHYLRRAQSLLKVHTLDGAFVRDVALPPACSVGGLGGKRTDGEAFFGASGFLFPRTTYRYDVAANELTVFRSPKVKFDPDAFVVKQFAYPSTGETHVTIFVMHRKDLKLDGKNPARLYGYGGFDISMTPWFSTSNIVWMEMGGVFAVANLRGGGEYGQDWHRAGMLKKKQNVFDDFIAAANSLVYSGYTSHRRLAIEGGSNGGLLVGACMTQAPEKFGACLPAVGVMDMLRYDKFTVGRAWATEYGSSDDPEMFPVLRAYSPYHNLRPGMKYPATMVTTGDHDDRVVPAHSYKFAARLQACQAGPAPCLIRIETKGGHGAGTPISKILDARTDAFAFLARVLGAAAPRSTAK